MAVWVFSRCFLKQVKDMHGRLADDFKVAVMKNKNLDEVLLKIFIERNAYFI